MAETNLIKKNDLAREREMEFVDQFGYSIKKLVEALGGEVVRILFLMELEGLGGQRTS